ncbi:MAG: ATP-binding protein [Saprospiraceae bacterium]|nr:ATP-binding protein [Saprospiraceae bacterium]
MRIVFTGPESTGKTSLAVLFSHRYKGKLNIEYSRLFLSEHGPDYTFHSISQMAVRQHINAMELDQNDALLFEDGDLLTYLIWQKVKFGKMDHELLKLWKEHPPSLYLICYPDVPWIFDPLREHPNWRMPLFKIYLEFILSHKCNFQIVSGVGAKRISKTEIFIRRFLKEL